LFLSHFLSCSKPPDRPASPAFYHWQTQLKLSDGERRYLDSLGVRRLYVKFFDVDWDETTRQTAPLAQVEIDTNRLANLEIVPTIFLTNRALVNLPEGAVDSLSGKIYLKIRQLYTFPKPFSEIQFDCDWTGQTRRKFFQLLTFFREKMQADSSLGSPLLSVTIRLHQFKFPNETGVPPADRGMLMFYNMGDLGRWETENSILDLAVARQYFSPKGQTYPLRLDAALPLFRWGAVYRDEELVKLIHEPDAVEFTDNERFMKISEHRFSVKKSTYLQGYYLYEGDKIRVEQITPARLTESKAVIKKMMDAALPPSEGTQRHLVFYHLDTAVIRRFPTDILENIAEGL
jgi:hypothetical protein